MDKLDTEDECIRYLEDTYGRIGEKDEALYQELKRLRDENRTLTSKIQNTAVNMTPKHEC